MNSYNNFYMKKYINLYYHILIYKPAVSVFVAVSVS